jgi:hypothetical protein
MQGALKIMRFHWWSLRTLCSNLFIHGQKRTIVSIFLVFFFFFFFFFHFGTFVFLFSSLLRISLVYFQCTKIMPFYPL